VWLQRQKENGCGADAQERRRKLGDVVTFLLATL